MAKFTCAMCHETFGKADPTNAEANAEAERIWGVKEASKRPDFRTVCDDCYEKIKPEDHPAQHAAALAELHQPKHRR